MFKLKKFKRILVAFTLCSMLSTTLGSQLAFATPTGSDPVTKKDKTQAANSINNSNTSNDRRIQSLKFAQGKTAGEIGSLDDLTAGDIQILGVFLSNFYTPWETRMTSMDKDKETMDDMVKALTTYCNFKEDVAQGIVNACWKVSMNASPVKVASYDIPSHTIKEPIVRGTDICHYDQMVYYMGGGNSSDHTDYCLYWEDGGSPKIIMESYNAKSYQGNMGKLSESAMAFAMTNGGVDYEYGVGSSLTTKSSREEATQIKATNDSHDFVTDWGIYVDSFGNLFVDTDDGRYVLLPACMSAYTWTTGDTAGQSIPMVNLIDIANTTHPSQNSTSALRIYAHTDSNGEGIVYDVGLDGGLFSKATQWAAYKNFGEGGKSDAYDLSTWHIIGNLVGVNKESNDNTMAKIASDRKLKWSDKSFWSASDWFFPNWHDLFDSISSAGGTSKFDYGTDLIYIDSVGAFSAEETPVLNTTENGIFSNETKWFDWNEDGIKQKDEYYYIPLEGMENEFGSGSMYFKNKNGQFKLGSSSASKYLVGIYCSYVLAYYGDSKVGYSFNKEGLPTITDKSLVYDNDLPIEDDGTQLKAIQNMAYYFLHPSEGIKYIKQWFKTKVSSILVGIHEDIVGSGDKANVGVTKYLGFSGYVTTPELTDLSWTAGIIDKYISIFIYLVILIVLIMTGYVMVGSLSIQKAIVGVAIFAVCAYYPPTLIDATISLSNSVSNSLYGQKFIYWALVENQAYATKMEDSATSGKYDDYLVKLFRNNAQWSQSDDGTGSVAIALKWMCPKKNNYMYSIKRELEYSTGSTGLSHLLNNIVSPQLSQETFVSASNSNYLYRSYSDISNYSRYLYKHLNTYGLQATDGITEKEAGVTVDNLKKASTQAFKKGFSVLSPDAEKTNIRWKALFSSKTLGNAMSEDLGQASSAYTYGLTQEDMEYDLTSVNKATSGLAKGGLYAYAEFTESPYYFFSWNFYDQGISAEAGKSGNFKQLMLGEKTGGKDSYFYNTKISGSGSGQVRDYLDMKNLFTAVMPVMRNANAQPLEWDNTYGLKTYKGVSCDPEAKSTDKATEADWTYKHWHNVNVAQLWNMYCPWIDTMYDCSYAKSENVTVAGKKFLVKDPLNPKSYPGEDNGRPMVFSKSEMEYWGLKTSDLTQVEIKIQKVQEETMTDLYQLMNYYNFNDSVLNSAASMMVTFNFNKEFSETNYISESFTMFPQNFDLKNFSYDAYLRLIMANATGESLQSKDDLYQSIVENSSIVTGVLLIINDFLSIYLVAGLKLFFLLGIFFMSIIMVVSASIRLEVNLLKTMWESLVLPLIKFLGVSIGHALVVSWFMSDGNLNVTGKTGINIALGDPSMTLCFMIIINTVVIVLYFGIVKGVVKNVVKFTSAVTSSIGGMAGGVFAGITGVAMASKMASGVGDAVRGGSRRGSVAERNNKVKDPSRITTATSKGGKSSNSEQSSISQNDIDAKCAKGSKRVNTNSKTGDTETVTNKGFGFKGTGRKTQTESVNDGKNIVKNTKTKSSLFGMVDHSTEKLSMQEKVGNKAKTISKDKVSSNTKIKAGRMFSYNLDRNYATGREQVTRKTPFGSKTVSRGINTGKVSGTMSKGKARFKGSIGNGAKKVKGVAKGLGAMKRR